MSNAYVPKSNPNTETGEVNADDVEDVGTQVGGGSSNTLRLYRPRVVVGGALRAEVAVVTNTDPGTSDYGLVVRPVGTLVDDAAFSVGTSQVFPVGAMLDDTSTDSVNEGDVGVVRMTSDRVLLNNPAFKTASATATGAGVMVASTDVIGYGYVSVQLFGTWVATVRFEVSNDNTNWEVCTLVKSADRNFYNTTTTTGIYSGPISGRRFRVRVQPYTSGTIEAEVMFSANASAVLTNEVTGDIAHDAADGQSPIKVGFKAYSPDGTTPGTAVSELNRTDSKADLDGRQYVNEEHPRWWSYHVNGSSALTDASVQADPGDGFQIVITEISFSSGAATAINMFLEESTTTVFGPIYLEAVAGRHYVWQGHKHITSSTAVTITTSAAIAHSVDIQGYIQAV